MSFVPFVATDFRGLDCFDIQGEIRKAPAPNYMVQEAIHEH